jgi:hypothetical protein
MINSTHVSVVFAKLLKNEQFNTNFEFVITVLQDFSNCSGLNILPLTKTTSPELLKEMALKGKCKSKNRQKEEYM